MIQTHLFTHLPFLNLIEKFWLKVKADIKRNALKIRKKILTFRIPEVLSPITQKGCKGWIKHAVKY